MDISKARRLVELEKGGRKILLTLWEGNQISSCVEEQETKYCETCQCDEELCQEYIEDMKARGYEATEVEIGDLELEESLPKFLQQREVPVEPTAEIESEPTVVEPEVNEEREERVSVTPVVEEELETIHRERTIEEVE